MPVRIAFLLAVLTLAAPGVSTQSPPQSADELAAALQRKYDTVRDFSADFVQTYRGGALNRAMKDTGRVVVRKPGKMRWEYKTPEEKLFVSDGVQTSTGTCLRTDRCKSTKCPLTTESARLCFFSPAKATSRGTSRPRSPNGPMGRQRGHAP